MSRHPLALRAALAAAAALSLGCGEGAMPSPLAPGARPALSKDSGSRLVSCAAPEREERATALIGPLGGVVRLGGTVVDVPAGAVPEARLFELVIPARKVVRVDVHAVGLAHFVFEQPITLTVDYSRCGPDAVPGDAEPEGVYVTDDDDDAPAVLERRGGRHDRAAQRVTFTTGHLSGYAVAF